MSIFLYLFLQSIIWGKKIFLAKRSHFLNSRLHVSKNHTKEDIEKICPYCHQKTGSLEHHIKIYHYEDKMKAQQLTKEDNKALLLGPELVKAQI